MPKEKLRQELFLQENLPNPGWFESLDLQLNFPQLYVQFPHELFKKFFMQQYKENLEKAAKTIWGDELNFTYVLKNFPAPAAPMQIKSPLTDFQIHEFGEDFTLNNFLSNNKYTLVLNVLKNFIAKAKKSILLNSTESIETNSSILVICGENSTGKTHLLRATANELYPFYQKKLFLSPLEDLEAQQNNLQLRELFLNKKLIILDNFQQISPNSILQVELCFLLDKLAAENIFLLISGTGQPKDWKLNKALFSRLEAGLWVDLPEPDLDIRLRFAINKAKLDKINLNRDKLLLLAQHCSNLRKLQGVLKRSMAQYQLLGRNLSELDLLSIIKQSKQQSLLTPQTIIGIVGEFFNLPAKDILGDKRQPKIVKARQIAMYLCRELLGHSYPVIGRVFKGKDHSTVIYGVKKIRDLKDSDNFTNTLVTELTKRCNLISNDS